jgi:F0F1-type ATP synthase membrane subunit a
LGLLLLDGSEGGEAKDFVSSVGEANFVPAVVAPLFLSNLGRHASESGALFVKICTIFAFILFSNVMGMLPYSDTSTSSLILTF